jgi:hypothetical protein
MFQHVFGAHSALVRFTHSRARCSSMDATGVFPSIGLGFSSSTLQMARMCHSYPAIVAGRCAGLPSTRASLRVLIHFSRRSSTVAPSRPLGFVAVPLARACWSQPRPQSSAARSVRISGGALFGRHLPSASLY